MKSFAIYALVALLTMGASAFIFHYVAQGAAVDEDALEEGSGFSHDAVRAEVDSYFDEFMEERLRNDDSKVGLYAGEIQVSIDEIRAGQKSLLDRLDAVANADPAAIKEGEYVIPDEAKVEAIVAQVVAREEERQQRERRERREKERKERDAQRRERTMAQLKEKLKLTPQQEAEMVAVMDRADAMRTEVMTQMREARQNGGNFDWQSMRPKFEEMGKEMDTNVRAILGDDQQKLYDDYKTENPFGAFGGGRWGGRGGMGGGRRGGNGGTRRGN